MHKKLTSVSSIWMYNQDMKFDGKAFARRIEERVAKEVAKLKVQPRIVSVLVGDDPASILYTNLKKAAAERVGIAFEVLMVSTDQLSEDSLYKQVAAVVSRKDVTGVMVQLPIPGLTREEQDRVISAITSEKDVDGLVWERSGVLPATVSAILLVMEEVGALKDKLVVVLGANGAIGRPLTLELRERGVKVIEIERRTPEPEKLVQQGSVIVSCVGNPGLVTAEMVAEGAIVIDVGMSETAEGKVVGDMTKGVYQKASVSVEVPGGVGPVTIACLLQNVVRLYA